MGERVVSGRRGSKLISLYEEAEHKALEASDPRILILRGRGKKKSDQ